MFADAKLDSEGRAQSTRHSFDNLNVDNAMSAGKNAIEHIMRASALQVVELRSTSYGVCLNCSAPIRVHDAVHLCCRLDAHQFSCLGATILQVLGSAWYMRCAPCYEDCTIRQCILREAEKEYMQESLFGISDAGLISSAST